MIGFNNSFGGSPLLPKMGSPFASNKMWQFGMPS